jgi:light-harvesting complex I chlorophyll a/b binding protein 4
MGLGADPVAMKWYRQAELQHARWAMLGAAGVLAQSVFVPNVFWYEAALHLPAGLGPVNLGSTLAVQFLLMHWAEVRRWQDMKVPGSVNQDPIFTNNKLPAGAAVGYPGGIFDPLNFAKGDLKEMQTKEIKNGAPFSCRNKRVAYLTPSLRC